MAFTDDIPAAAQLASQAVGRRVTFDESNNRTHYTFASYAYDRSYAQGFEPLRTDALAQFNMSYAMM